MGCLYILTSPSGKSYVGISAKTAEERWRVHNMRVREGRDNALQQAIRKYGASSFSLRTLLTADNWDYLCLLEKRAIAVFNTRSPNGYNLTTGGEGVVGKVITAQARSNMSKGQVRRYADPVQRQKLREYGNRARALRKKPPVKKRKPGEAAKELWANPEYRQRMIEAIRRAANTPTAKANHIRAARERAANPEWKKKMIAAKTGKKLPPATEQARRNHSAGAKKMWAKRKAADAEI